MKTTAHALYIVNENLSPATWKFLIQNTTNAMYPRE
jgi:hypothetical protein